MVTRSEWVAKVAEAWRGEPCPRCGRALPVAIVDDEGNVYAYCGRCNLETWVAREVWPEKLDPEPEEAEDIPF